MTSRSDDYTVKRWLKATLEDLDRSGLEEFKWYLNNAEESEDGFKPIPVCRLENATRLDTVNLMMQRFSSKTRDVAETVLKKMKSEKEKPVVQDGPVSPAGATEYGCSEDENMLKHIRLFPKDNTSPRSVTSAHLPTDERLLEVRSSLIERISGPVLQSLLDQLLGRRVISYNEFETANEKTNRGDRVRCVVDTVRRKGPDASSVMIEILKDLDQYLCKHLDLI